MKATTIILILATLIAINALNLAHQNEQHTDSLKIVITIDEASLVNGQKTVINPCFSDVINDTVT